MTQAPTGTQMTKLTADDAHLVGHIRRMNRYSKEGPVAVLLAIIDRLTAQGGDTEGGPKYCGDPACLKTPGCAAVCDAPLSPAPRAEAAPDEIAEKAMLEMVRLSEDMRLYPQPASPAPTDARVAEIEKRHEKACQPGSGITFFADSAAAHADRATLLSIIKSGAVVDQWHQELALVGLPSRFLGCRTWRDGKYTGWRISGKGSLNELARELDPAHPGKPEGEGK